MVCPVVASFRMVRRGKAVTDLLVRDSSGNVRSVGASRVMSVMLS